MSNLAGLLTTAIMGGFDYGLVHLKYTIPPAVVLTLIYRPFLIRLDFYKLAFLITVAVTATIPWDDYLIRAKIWTYPPNVILGPKLLSIPAEEVFFFFIQTYNTTLLYLVLGRTSFYPSYLVLNTAETPENHGLRNAGQIITAFLTAIGFALCYKGGEGTYLGLILAWAGPFCLMLWTFAYQFLTRLPALNTLVPIAVPTLYLCIVDTIALRRGTWAIESGTKTGINLWHGLDIEEAIFFLLTNTMVVFGLVAFDNALAILQTFPHLFAKVPQLPSPTLLIQALSTPTSQYDINRIIGLKQAVARLQRKSRSFFLASSTFEGRLRIDLILLYSFCRVADDMVDNARDGEEAVKNTLKLRKFLDIAYDTQTLSKQGLHDYVVENFPPGSQSALLLLPTYLLSPKPLYDLLEGFTTDSSFSMNNDAAQTTPIKTEKDLHQYGYRVAGSVAQMVLELCCYHTTAEVSTEHRKFLIHAGGQMGIALQYVNIARDIATDAAMKRVYLPQEWLEEEGLQVNDVLRISPQKKASILTLRTRILNKAFDLYLGARPIMEQLPLESRGPLRVAIESYMEIGRILQEQGPTLKYKAANKATVPVLRRMVVAWKAMNGSVTGIPVKQLDSVSTNHDSSVNGHITTEQKQPPNTAIVVGAGTGGVATAARLAKAGFQVTVFEKNDFTGGRCSLLHHGGYRFDQGPSLLLLPKMFQECFYDLDTSMEAEGVHILKCEPNYNIWFSDGNKFELSTDVARMKREIERWEGKDGFERYLSFLAEAHRHYELSVIHVLKKNFTGLLSMARWSFVSRVFSLHPFESIYDRASKYFRTDRLRRVFTFASMYMGMSPFNAPGTYSLLQYTELSEGIWYPIGGFNKVIQAIEAIGRRLGVEYRLNTPISSILLNPANNQTHGVILESGEKVYADVVICNADLVYAYSNLLPDSSTARSLVKRDGSCSSISFYWAMDRKVPELLAHNIFLAEEYKDSFDAIFDRQSIPMEPSFYVNVPTRIDPTAAPPGCDALVVLVPTGHLLNSRIKTDFPRERSLPENDWDAIITKTRDTICSIVEARTGCTDIKKHIIHEIVNDPFSWESKFNLDKGAILGLSHSFFNVLSFRPSIKHKSIANLFFVGASTHPGTGVPIILAGSKLTSETILQEFGMEIPWEWKDSKLDDEGVRQDATTKEIDREKALVTRFEKMVLTVGAVGLVGVGVFAPWNVVIGGLSALVR